VSYLTAADIKSNLVNGFDINSYLDEADSEINDLAERVGVRDSSSISTPIHYKLKRYGVVFVLMRLAQDKIGTNSPDVALEKYRDLYEMYKTELRDLTPQITYEMITGTVNSMIARTSVFNLYRG
jgi:hypothetical protein